MDKAAAIRLAVQVGIMLVAYIVLKESYNAPSWGALVGAWVVWAAIRPKEWM